MKRISLAIVLAVTLSLSVFVFASPYSSNNLNPANSCCTDDEASVLTPYDCIAAILAGTALLCACRVCSAPPGDGCKGVRPPTEPIDWPLDCRVHDWVVTSVIDPTCHTRGYTIETCSQCNRSRVTNHVFRLRCDFGSGTTCTRCDRVQTISDTNLVFYRRTTGNQAANDGNWGLVPDDIINRLISTFDAQFENIFDYFARPTNNRPVIRYVLDIRAGSVGWASGGTLSGLGLGHILNNPWDTCLMVHELVHNAQAYTGFSGNTGWIVEGIADYGRHLFGMYNAQAGWRLPRYASTQHWTNAFGPTAAFFYWLASPDGFNDANIIRDLNHDIQNGLTGAQANGNWWVNRTTYTVAQLWAQYGAANFDPPPPR